MKDWIPYIVMGAVAIILGIISGKRGPNWKKEATNAQDALAKQRHETDRADLDAAMREFQRDFSEFIEKPTSQERIKWVLADSLDAVRRRFGR